MQEIPDAHGMTVLDTDAIEANQATNTAGLPLRHLQLMALQRQLSDMLRPVQKAMPKHLHTAGLPPRLKTAHSYGGYGGKLAKVCILG